MLAHYVQYGPQMPFTGALNSEQINFIKAWIDQGAEWPAPRKFAS